MSLVGEARSLGDGRLRAANVTLELAKIGARGPLDEQMSEDYRVHRPESLPGNVIDGDRHPHGRAADLVGDIEPRHFSVHLLDPESPAQSGLNSGQDVVRRQPDREAE